MQICGLPILLYRLYNLSYKLPEAGSEALKRLDVLKKWKKLKEDGAKDQTIAEVLDVSRATFYRYQKAFKRDALMGLKPLSRRPHTIRISKKITPEITSLVRSYREQNVTYGKFKIAHILKRDEDMIISESTVGRILKQIMNKRIIKKVTAFKPKRRRNFDAHAQKWDISADRTEPGRMIQIDHMTVSLGAGITYKHFQAWDPKTKMIVAQVYCRATSASAAKFLDFVEEQLPFKIESIQVDGGSEFMKDFEAKAKEKKIPMFVLPPRSPKFNGGVERGNRIFREEFYATQADDTYNLETLRPKLQKALKTYNTYRPHRSLDRATSTAYYESIMETKVSSAA